MLVVVTGLLSSTAGATSFLSAQIPATPQSCQTCHTGGPGSPRNTFGQQVETHHDGDPQSGSVDWATVCALDADGDGSSNGAELGDPCCVWTPGASIDLPTADPNDAAVTSTNHCGTPDAGAPVDAGVIVDAGPATDAGVVVDAGPQAPAGWTCSAALFANGSCDCGCGVVDEDCADSSYAACEHNGCDAGVVDVVAPTTCLAAADDSAWTCGFAAYDDGDVCDCGCGVADPDCPDSSRDSCDASGCGPGHNIDDDDPTGCVENADLQGARPGWWCPTAWYAADDGCDCGCGLVDPDCPRAPSVDDCSQQGCAFSDVGEDGVVDGRDIAMCIVPGDAPAEWTCDAIHYDAGDGCDCGCGVVDPDCTDDSIAYCAFSGCADDDEVDESNPASCVSAHNGFGCSHSASSSASWWMVLSGLLLFAVRRRRRR